MMLRRLFRNILKVLRPTTLTAPNAVKSALVKTHTGQVSLAKFDSKFMKVFEANDCRSARFMQSPKLVNKQFAIDLINSVPPKQVTDRVVACNGGDGALGHPKVYINLDKPGPHTCGYCGLRYEKVILNQSQEF